MYCVSYKFTLLSNNSETRRQFIEVWAGLTQFFKESCGALGSRLHYSGDGCFYAYAPVSYTHLTLPTIYSV